VTDCYLTMLFHLQWLYRTTMNGEHVRIFKEVIVSNFKILFQHSHDRLNETMRNVSQNGF